MPITVFSAGIFATKVGTSHILTITDTAGVYQFKAHVGSLITGDNVALRMRTSIRSGDVIGIEFERTFVNTITPEVIRTSIPMTTVTTGEYLINVTSSGVAGSGTGSNGPVIGWTVLGIN